MYIPLVILSKFILPVIVEFINVSVLLVNITVKLFIDEPLSISLAVILNCCGPGGGNISSVVTPWIHLDWSFCAVQLPAFQNPAPVKLNPVSPWGYETEPSCLESWLLPVNPTDNL